MASSTSDVVKKKLLVAEDIKNKNLEIEENQNKLNALKLNLQKNTEELAEIERKINHKSQEIQKFARSITQKSKGFRIFAAIVPFIGLLLKNIYDAVRDPENVAHMKVLEAELNNLFAEKTVLKQNQWQLELHIIDWQMKCAKANFEQSESVFFHV